LSPLDLASLVVIGASALGIAGATAYALLRARGGPDGRGVAPRTALARAGSYTVLAVLVTLAARGGPIGIALFLAVVGAAGLVEWGQLFDLPIHHRVALVLAQLVIVVAVLQSGVGAAAPLVGGLVLVGAAWPVVRPDTGRAVRDLGLAAVGCLFVSVLLVHGLALVVDRGEAGAVVFVALAVACAGSDVGAFIVGRRFGRTPLALRLSPSKTRAGLVGNLVGAAVGIGALAPALVPVVGSAFTLLLVPLAAGGAVWGDLLESAIKREAGVKDAGAWLPGFGGILDRIDSLLITLALAYWILRVGWPG
jgi:phosphatidate cytidylyltransferase